MTRIITISLLLILGYISSEKWGNTQPTEPSNNPSTYQQPALSGVPINTLPNQETTDYSQDSPTRYQDVDSSAVPKLDLIEQGRMADATETQISIGWLAFFLNAVGLLILWKALGVSIDAANAARTSADAQLQSIRPWIALDSTSFSHNGIDKEKPTAIFFHLVWKNTGESPATNIAVTACHYAAGTEPLTVPIASNFAENNNVGFLAKGATSEGKLEFTIAEIDEVIKSGRDLICFMKAEYSFPSKGGGGTLLCYRLTFGRASNGYKWESGIEGSCSHIF
jgi:hypothetical protein